MRKQVVKLIGVLILLLSISCTWLSLPEDEEGISFLELPNGLQLVIKEDNNKPVIALNALIRIYEKLPSPTDLLKSQLLASLLTQGTKNYPTPLAFQKHVETLQIFLKIEAQGPNISLYLEAPSTQRENLILTLVEILREAEIDPTEFARCKKHMQFSQATSHLEAISHNDIMQLYKEKLVSSNTVLTIIGDFGAKRLVRFVKKRTGELQKGTKLPFPSIPAHVVPEEAGIQGNPQDLGTINISFFGPEASDIEAPSFIMAAFILERFFSQKAVENNIVFSLRSDLAPMHKNLLCIFHIRAHSLDAPKIQKLFSDSVYQLQQGGVSQKTYEEALNFFKLTYFKKNAALESLAQELSAWQMAGDYKKRAFILQKTSVQSHKDVQSALSKFFKAANPSAPSTPKNEFKSAEKETLFHLPQKRENVLSQFKLSNGISLLIHSYTDVNFVSGSVSFKVTGAQSQDAIALYLNSLLQGTNTFDRETFKKELLRLGVSLNTFYKSDIAGFYFSVVKDNLEPLLFLLADTLFSAKLNEEGIQFARKKTMVDNPHIFAQTEKAVKNIVFKNTGQQEEPSQKTIKTIHEKNIFAKNLNIVLIGDVTSVNAKRLVEKYFGKASAREPEKKQILDPVPPSLSQESYVFGKTPYQLSTFGFVLPVSDDFFYMPDIFSHYLCSQIKARIPQLLDCGFEKYLNNTLFLFSFAHDKGDTRTIMKDLIGILKEIKNTEISSDTALWLEGSSNLILRFPQFADEAQYLALHLHHGLPLQLSKMINLFSKKDLKTIVNDQLNPLAYSLGSVY